MPRSLRARESRDAVFPPERVRRGRFSIETILDPVADSTLAEDVRRGLSRAQKSVPPKYFYDDRGSRLFDSICELPEYYLTRAEQAMLEQVAPEVMALARPTDLVELGSGAARKTRTLLDAAGVEGLALRYRPVDVCEPMLRASAAELLVDYPWLEVHAVVGDYERQIDRLPSGGRRLVVFLGSTIGNYAPRPAAEFLRRLAAGLCPGEWFLLGADLVKPIERIEAAYDDAAGITAEFNRNILLVMNRELGADFRAEAFDHVAFFHRSRSQIEMHLRAREEQRVTVRRLGLTVTFRAGETLHTEISRKFTRRGLRELCRRAGFLVRRLWTPADASFALVLAERK